MKAYICAGVLAAVPLLLNAQNPEVRDLVLRSLRPLRPAIAIPVFRGSGAAQSSMEVFNRTLAADLWQSRLFTLIPRAMYPLSNPQQPADLGDKDGKKLSNWAGPPTHARYLAFGYTAIVRNKLTLYAWLFDVTRRNAADAQIFGKIYTEDSSESGARNLAHHFAADIAVKTTSGADPR